MDSTVAVILGLISFSAALYTAWSHRTSGEAINAITKTVIELMAALDIEREKRRKLGEEVLHERKQRLAQQAEIAELKETIYEWSDGIDILTNQVTKYESKPDWKPDTGFLTSIKKDRNQ